MGDWNRPLTDSERTLVDAARAGARLRYEGRIVAHRSCGIALAETFGRATPAYQSLRRGGITGVGECGTSLGGRMVLGELLGDPDPGGATTALLKAAVTEYDARWPERVGVVGSRVCNDLTAPFEDFKGTARKGYCTRLAAETAALVAEVLVRNGVHVEVEDLGGP